MTVAMPYGRTSGASMGTFVSAISNAHFKDRSLATTVPMPDTQPINSEVQHLAI